MTSTSAYLAACADATQPLIRTVFFLVSATVGMIHSDLNVLCCPLAQIFQLFCLPPVKSRRDGERRVHAHDAGFEVEFRHALQAARRTFLDAHTATFAVVDQDFVKAVRTHVAHDARFGTDQITVIAGVAGAAAEAARGLLDGLLFGERLNHFVLRFATAHRRQERLLHAREVREIRHVHAVQIEDDIHRNRPGLERHTAQHLIQIEGDALTISNRVYYHQRLTRTELHDIARCEKVRVAQTSEAVDLDRAALSLELIRQPSERRSLSYGDDYVVHSETLGRDSRST